MARHKRDYCGEELAEFVGFKCTSGQRRELVAAAGRQSVTISDFAREILFGYLNNTPITPIASPDSETDAKISAMKTATDAVNNLGNLLNPIARHLHTAQDLGPFAADLCDGLRTWDHAAAALLAATEKLIAAPDGQTHAKISAMKTATHAVNILGSLMNQIARHVNMTEELGPFTADLREGIRTCEHVAAALLAAAEKLIAA